MTRTASRRSSFGWPNGPAGCGAASVAFGASRRPCDVHFCITSTTVRLRPLVPWRPRAGSGYALFAFECLRKRHTLIPVRHMFSRSVSAGFSAPVGAMSADCYRSSRVSSTAFAWMGSRTSASARRPWPDRRPRYRPADGLTGSRRLARIASSRSDGRARRPRRSLTGRRWSPWRLLRVDGVDISTASMHYVDIAWIMTEEAPRRCHRGRWNLRCPADWHLQDRCPLETTPSWKSGNPWAAPGICSLSEFAPDSDMYTLGFRFVPGPDGRRSWRQATSTSPAAMYGIDRHVSFPPQVIGADWSTAENRWTVHIKATARSFLFCAAATTTRSYSPDSLGGSGPIIHPPLAEDLDYDAKNIVVIGSGTTAVTLCRHWRTRSAKHVTMLQRSPTYIVSQPDRDGIAKAQPRPAAGDHGFHRGTVEKERAVPGGRVQRLPGHGACGCSEPDPAPATRGEYDVRKRLRPAPGTSGVLGA